MLRRQEPDSIRIRETMTTDLTDHLCGGEVYWRACQRQFYSWQINQMFYSKYLNHIPRMNYTRKYDLRIPEINERIREFLKTKHLAGQVKHEFHPGNVNIPTGLATLTVDSADPRLNEELNSFISYLERNESRS